MNRQAIWAIAEKDMRAVRANLQVWLPMLIVPALLGVVLPGALILALRLTPPEANGQIQELLGAVAKLPPSALTSVLEGMALPNQKAAYLLANYFLAPFFLLIPLMTTSVIAADSFAGEKERGTLESLLFSPVDLVTLFAGKALAAFLPSVLLSAGAFLLCGVVVNLAGWPLFGQLFFPTLNWLPLMLLVIPCISLAAIFFNLWVSAKVATFQAAYQMGAVAVLPLLGLIVGQATGLLLLDAGLLTAVGFVLALLDLGLLWLFVRGLDRAKLFETHVR